MKPDKRNGSTRAAAALFLLAAWATTASSASAQLWSQIDKLRAGNPGPDDHFGHALALDGDTAIIGALTADGAAPDTGAAFIFSREPGGAWTETARLFSADSQPFDWFGYSVAIDGDVAAIGSVFGEGNQSGSGTAFVFRRDPSGVWTQEARLIAPDGEQDDRFGHSIAIDGNTIVVGCPQDTGNNYQSGSAYVFKRDQSGQWLNTQRLIASDGEAYDLFGFSVAIEGNGIVIGSPQDGDFGYASGAAYVFGTQGTGYLYQLAKLHSADAQEADYFATSVDTAGPYIIIGAPSDDDRGANAGAAYIFSRDPSGAWLQQAKLLADDGDANDQLGISVSIDGTLAIAGAYWEGTFGSNVGAAYAFSISAGQWTQEQKLAAPDGASGDWFGQSVAISASTSLIGSPNDDDSVGGSGSAYVFQRHTSLSLQVAGSCPGPMQLAVAGATPRSNVALIASFSLGAFILPRGPCQGYVIDLRPPFAPGTPLLARADAQGRLLISGAVPAPACGVSIQAIDAATCVASNRLELR